jgi:putative DNA primase/helicase
LGKPLAIISDARLSSNAPTHTIVERLLSISGEDLLTVDRKFRDPWSGRLPTRFVILSNELPRFKDSSGAVANRLLILRMTESFLGREDRTLDDRLRAELPGILSWALEGLDRLNRNGRFTVPDSSEDAANLMMDLASPVSAFVRECCIRDPRAIITRDDLYGAWKQWANDNGHMAGAKSTFGRDLRAVVPEARASRPRVLGVQVHCYGGIGLQSYGLNGVRPDSPRSVGQSAGHGDADESGDPDSPPYSQPRPRAESGHPDSNGAVKQQVNACESGEAGTSPFKAQPWGPDTGSRDDVLFTTDPPSTNGEARHSPPGAPTENTPGMTPRVWQSLEKARANGDSRPLCPCGRPAPVDPDTGLCQWCMVKASKRTAR